MLIGILGNKRHGKDTISDYLVQQFNFTKDALATPIKDICEILFHFDNDQLYGDKKEIPDEYWNVSARQVMQFIGTDLFRNQMGKLIPDMKNNFWIRHFEYKYYKIYQNKNIVVSDIRFQNEVDMIHSLGGIIIKVYRPDYPIDTKHPSEKGIHIIKNYDYQIINDSNKQDLYKKINELYLNNIQIDINSKNLKI